MESNVEKLIFELCCCAVIQESDETKRAFVRRAAKRADDARMRAPLFEVPTCQILKISTTASDQDHLLLSRKRELFGIAFSKRSFVTRRAHLIATASYDVGYSNVDVLVQVEPSEKA
jgi:hypothetical protein